MRRNRYIFIIIVLVLFVPIVIMTSGCGKHERGSKASQGKAVYYCPMHPTYTSDRPGDCPICGMKLVKKEAPLKQKEESQPGVGTTLAPEKNLEEVCIEHDCTMKDCLMRVKTYLKPGERIMCPICGEVISTAGGKVVEISKQPSTQGPPSGPTIMISPEKQQLIGVKTEPVKMMKLEKLVRASGRIAYDPELVVTQEEFVQALKNEENVKDSPLADVIDRAKSLTDAARRKLKLLGMSDEQILELEKTKQVQTGLYLPGKGESVWAYVSIYEYEIGLVKVAADVEIEATAYPGEKLFGKAMSINPVLDPGTRTNQVRIQLPNPEDKLKPEMFVNAQIKVDLGEKLAVPVSAVLDTGLRKIVYLSEEGGMLESREVNLGQKAEGYYEVLGGLSEGDIVVTSGNFLIDSETRLKSIAGPTEEQGHKHGQ